MLKYVSPSAKLFIYKLMIEYLFYSADRSLEGLLLKWGLRCVHVPLSSFDADLEATHNHTIHMLVITRKSGIT